MITKECCAVAFFVSNIWFFSWSWSWLGLAWLGLAWLGYCAATQIPWQDQLNYYSINYPNLQGTQGFC
jgi:hypothetical protein